MEDDEKSEKPGAKDELKLMRRRDFLQGLKKWSKAVIGGIVLGKVLSNSEAEAAWVNRRASWVNGGGGGGWVNRSVGWVNGGGAWVNGGATWLNNRSGGGWINRRGGGGWLNARE